MTSVIRKTFSLLVACLGLAMMTPGTASSTSPTLPNPVLVFIGPEYYQTGGKSFIRYQYNVDNFSAYPNDLFAAAPNLPPCGANTKAARTWVDFYEQNGKRLYGFCALGSPADLNKIWFALEENVIPPSWVYIEMTDRQTGTKYKSNLADTTL
jgi:hypothetical protein